MTPPLLRRKLTETGQSSGSSGLLILPFFAFLLCPRTRPVGGLFCRTFLSRQVLRACPFNLAACPWARVLVRRGLAARPWSVCGSEGVWLHAPGLYAGQKGSGCTPLVCMRVRRGLAARPWSVCGSEGVWLHAPGLYAGQKGSGCTPLASMLVRRGLAACPWPVC